MQNQIAFIDEFGNSGLDFSQLDVSTHFIITAILVDAKKIKDIETQVDNVRKKHFQTGEMKSAGIASNDARRSRVLADLSKIDFHVFSVVVDKTALKGEGFNYKPSFYKFLHS